MAYRMDTKNRNCKILSVQNVLCPAHLQYEIEWLLVLEGTLHMTCNHTAYEIPAGHAFYVEPFEPHAFDSRTDNHCIILECRPDLVPLFFDLIRTQDTDNRILQIRPPALAYLESMLPQQTTAEALRVLFHAMPEQTMYQWQLPQMQMQTMIQVLSYEYMTYRRYEPCRKQYDDSLIDALHIVVQQLQEPMTLSSVARQVGVRPETLSRKYTSSLGMTFTAYLHLLRVRQAASLLEQGYSITEAAMTAGFGSINSFNRIFKEVTGGTATEFLLGNHADYLHIL